MSFARERAREELDPRLNESTSEIIGAAMAVHSALGPSLLESTCEACITHELRMRGLTVEAQVALRSFMTA